MERIGFVLALLAATASAGGDVDEVVTKLSRAELTPAGRALEGVRPTDGNLEAVFRAALDAPLCDPSYSLLDAMPSNVRNMGKAVRVGFGNDLEKFLEDAGDGLVAAVSRLDLAFYRLRVMQTTGGDVTQDAILALADKYGALAKEHPAAVLPLARATKLLRWARCVPSVDRGVLHEREAARAEAGAKLDPEAPVFRLAGWTERLDKLGPKPSGGAAKKELAALLDEIGAFATRPDADQEVLLLHREVVTLARAARVDATYVTRTIRLPGNLLMDVPRGGTWRYLAAQPRLDHYVRDGAARQRLGFVFQARSDLSKSELARLGMETVEKTVSEAKQTKRPRKARLNRAIGWGQAFEVKGRDPTGAAVTVYGFVWKSDADTYVFLQMRFDKSDDPELDFVLESLRYAE